MICRPMVMHRVERGHRVLEDHREVAAAPVAHALLVEGEQVDALEQHRARDRRRRGAAAGRMAASEVTLLPDPGLPHHAHGLAGQHREAHPVDGDDVAAVLAGEGDPQVVDLEERLRCSPPVLIACGSWGRGPRAATPPAA